jgi:hypothetical protein
MGRGCVQRLSVILLTAANSLTPSLAPLGLPLSTPWRGGGEARVSGPSGGEVS